MFQPHPTPFAQFVSYGINPSDADAHAHAHAGYSDYAFQPTPLGQYGGGHAGGAGPGHGAGAGTAATTNANASLGADAAAAAGVRGGPTAAGILASSAFHHSVEGANGHHLNLNLDHNHGLEHNHNHLHHHHNNNNNNNNNNTRHHNAHHSHGQNQSRQQRRIPQHSIHRTRSHHHNRTRARFHSHGKMDPSGSDFAQQQAAAEYYKPDLKGDFVGQRTLTQNITDEFAQADSIYVAKTKELPRSYPNYRPIQGDGNCGWRAIAFAYFEILIEYGDISYLERERARIAKISDSDTLISDLAEATDVLFSDLIAAMSEGGRDPTATLISKFNFDDEYQSPAMIIYHQRLLARYEMMSKPDDYMHFVPEQGRSPTEALTHHIEQTITGLNREMEHIGVQALANILLKPAGIGLEIAYLDRSEGHAVNTLRFTTDDSLFNWDQAYAAGRVVQLLYRPDHYDILYSSDQSLHATHMPPAPISIQVNRATFGSHHDFQSNVPSLGEFSTVDMSALAMIPGFEAAGMSPLGTTTSVSPPMTDPYAPSPQSPWMAQPFPEAIPAPPSQQPSPPQQQPTTPLTVQHQLRFSKYNFPNLPEMAETSTSHEPAFMTNTFKNSHFNVAHYNNMNFQPEMYRPDAEEDSAALSKRSGGRKRSNDMGTASIKRESVG
ncbi:cysteine proteinase [Xylariaceae sp. FL0016]|nr:cysteine proteinase [Xylariaceae sp. FL0016]